MKKSIFSNVLREIIHSNLLFFSKIICISKAFPKVNIKLYYSEQCFWYFSKVCLSELFHNSGKCLIVTEGIFDSIWALQKFIILFRFLFLFFLVLKDDSLNLVSIFFCTGKDRARKDSEGRSKEINVPEISLP